MAGALTITGTQTGSPEGGTRNIGPFTITPGTSGVVTEVNLVSGANTITVPTNAAGCIIQPPSANTIALTLKGVTGDTGIALSLTGPTLMTFPATPPASFVITAASGTTGNTAVMFF